MSSVIRGRVQTGKGDAAKWLRLFNDAYARKLGAPLFPGSLNLGLAQRFDWFEPALQAHVQWFGREEYGGERDILLLACTLVSLEHRPAFLWTTTNGARDRVAPALVEVLCDVGLRAHYGLRDGDEVEVALPVAPLIADTGAAVVRIALLDHRDPRVARRIHAISMWAYTQEAALIGARDFPPLQGSVEALRDGSASFIGAFVGSELVGALGREPDSDGMGVNVASLVVAPPWQRRGVARALLQRAIDEDGAASLTVQTAERNEPALRLYVAHGFAAIREWRVGDESLALVKLLRPGSPSRV